MEELRCVGRSQQPVDGVVRHRVTAAGCSRGVDDTAAECSWSAAGKASQDVHPDSAADAANHSVQHDMMARRRWKRSCVRWRALSASSESDSDTLLTITLFLLFGH